jgi:hypothetical protein
MTKDEFLNFHAATCQKMMETVKAKNADYTGNNPDPFANFSSVEGRGICSTEIGMLVRLNDKFQRIISFVQKGFLLVADESVEDTCIDAANYFIFLAGYFKSKREKSLKVL